MTKDKLKNKTGKTNIVKPHISNSVYAFDVNEECYCSLCCRHYKNYKRFVIHMKKQKHFV